MHSYLVCYGTRKDRQTQVKRLITSLRGETKTKIETPIPADPDIFVLKPQPSIGIEAVRQVSSILKLKPYQSSVKIVIFLSADRITLQAQHALLKTLEEPSPHSALILETRNPYTLLPTVRSRCQLIPVKSQSRKKTIHHDVSTILNNLTQPSLSLRLKTVNEISDKKKARKLIRSLLTIGRNNLQTDLWWLSVVKLTHQALLDLEKNLNPRLVLEHLALKFPTKPK